MSKSCLSMSDKYFCQWVNNILMENSGAKFDKIKRACYIIPQKTCNRLQKMQRRVVSTDIKTGDKL